MSNIVNVKKPVILKFENREVYLPNKLKEDIKKFWDDAIKENPSLYNGQDYVVETVKETQDKIEMSVTKSDYSHYLYDERIGIKEDKYRCCAPWGGILLLTKDNYFVVGEMDKITSMPYCLQISGGGIDEEDIINEEINIIATIKREAKEELNISLEDMDYQIEFIEYPNQTRNAYGFIALGKMKQSKSELEKHFEEYKKYLIKNNLETEFNRLLFLSKENAVEELDQINNPKRPYLRDLIIEAIKSLEKFESKIKGNER